MLWYQKKCTENLLHILSTCNYCEHGVDFLVHIFSTRSSTGNMAGVFISQNIDLKLNSILMHRLPEIDRYWSNSFLYMERKENLLIRY